MSIISNILDHYNINATIAQAEDFGHWALRELWDKYNESRMNNRIVIENKVKALGIHLPNGTVNNKYSQEIVLPIDLVEECKIEDCDGLGLTISVGQDEKVYRVVLNGKPKQAGDFNLSVRYKAKGWIEGEPWSILTIPVAFNADPRTLWKELPTPETIPFYKRDSESAYIKVEEVESSGPRKDMVAASLRGRSHAQEAKPRDDHFSLYHCDQSDWYIMVVADGAGSAKYSRQGSKIACDEVIKHCRENLLECMDFENKITKYSITDSDDIARKSVSDEIYKIVGVAAFKAHKAILDAAKINKDTAKDYATTLLFSICKKFDFGWFVASYWVGDGAMCIYNKEKQTFKLLGIPDEGEFAGQTRFLTMPEIFMDGKAVFERLRFSIEEDFTALLLMTDGVSDPMFETDKNLNSIEKWNELWDKLQNGFPDDGIKGVDLSDDNEKSKDQLLEWLKFWSPGNHDDRTIAILY